MLSWILAGALAHMRHLTLHSPFPSPSPSQGVGLACPGLSTSELVPTESPRIQLNLHVVQRDPCGVSPAPHLHQDMPLDGEKTRPLTFS